MAHSCTCIRHCRLASPRVNEPYAHRRRACDSRNYRRVIVEISTYQSMEVLYGVSMWGIIIEISTYQPMEVLHGVSMWGIIIEISTYRPMEVLHGVSMWGIIIEISTYWPMEVLHGVSMWGTIIEISTYLTYGGFTWGFYVRYNKYVYLLSHVVQRSHYLPSVH